MKEYEFCDLQNNKAFTLDLNALQHTLSVIPFHERCDLDEAYLTVIAYNIVGIFKLLKLFFRRMICRHLSINHFIIGNSMKVI